MDMSFNQILGQVNDLNKCERCHAWNWYENEICHDCGHDEFLDLTEEDVQKEIEARKNAEYHFCYECEVDV